MVALPEHQSPTGWELFRMEGLSWLNLILGLTLMIAAAIQGLEGWLAWSALVVGGVVVVLEAFDEWAEQHELAREVVGPESVVLLAGLWLVGTALVVGGPTGFVALTAVAGAVIAMDAALNVASALRMEPPETG